MPRSYFTEEVIRLLKSVPKGKVVTYGYLAGLAGNHRGARQVARILHSCSKNEELPWHRVINSRGFISLKKNNGYEIQKRLLENEGIFFGDNDRIDMDLYLWTP